ncbi:MAG: hypothetical protein ACI4O5_02715 [Oscillospiraceae bacterium]
MKKKSKQIAVCGVTAALGVVIMMLGAVLGIGMYLAPMLVGVCLIPIGREWGAKYQILLWIVISLLSLILVSEPEENLMFLGLFGWYPILRPTLQKLPPVLRVVVKLLIFNVVVIALELLLLLVLVPEGMGTALTVLLLVLGNVTFLVYDFAIPRFEMLAAKYLKRVFRLS